MYTQRSFEKSPPLLIYNRSLITSGKYVNIALFKKDPQKGSLSNFSSISKRINQLLFPRNR